MGRIGSREFVRLGGPMTSLLQTRPRDIEFRWWSEPDILCFFIGDQISFHDLYLEEVRALIDELQFLDCDPEYQPQQRTAPPYRGSWWTWIHPCQPGESIQAFADWIFPTDYQPEGDAWDESKQELIWTIHSGSASVTITEEEAVLMVSKFQ